MVDASGVINSNPNGLAAELPWEPFHDRSERGHARWTGAYESASARAAARTVFANWAGIGGCGFTLDLGAGGRLWGRRTAACRAASFFDLIWEQNLTVEAPISNGERYYVVISNPTDEQMPYYFVVQTIQDGGVDEVVKFTGQLDPEGLSYLPLKLSLDDGVLGVEVVTFTRKIEGKVELGN